MLLGACLPTHAAEEAATPERVYVWEEAASGRTRMAGSAPSWYRSGAAGPRVRVFEHGRLVDDTAVAVDAATREALTRTAFGAARGEAIAQPLAASEDAATDESADAVLPPDDAADTLVESPPAPPAAAPRTAPPENVNAMRRLLELWDAVRAAEARATVAPSSPPAEAAPAAP